MSESYAHIEVSLSEDGSDNGDANESLSIMLDDVFNGGVSEFPANGDVFLLILHSASYETDKSMGVLSRVGTGVMHEVTQRISFAYSDSGSLSHVPASIVSWEWIGNSAGTPAFDGKNITLPAPETGLLEVVYRVEADRWKLVSSQEGDVVVSAYQEEGSLTASITVAITGDGAQVGPFVLNVKDFCNDGISIEGVAVWLDSVYKGLTNAAGQVSLGMLTQGQHLLTMSVGGYLASNADHLNNDSFTV